MSIASTGGVTGTLIGTILPLLPPYLPVLFVLSALWRKWGLALISAIATALISPAFATLQSGLHAAADEVVGIARLIQEKDYVSIVTQFPVPSACGVLGILLTPLWAHSAATKHANFFLFRFMVHLPWGLIVGAVAVASTSFIQHTYRVPFDFSQASEMLRRPWVPVEEVHLRSSGSRVGYTIGTKDGWFVMLLEHDRSVEYILSTDVATRKVCTPRSSQPQLPLLPLQGAVPHTSRACTANS
ncbi:hypothetical protein [Pseudonocardia spinosispora]|uniref:hypothetical protein n=1 Tax=Pseudonocardia spinosispora TaxID=103441 RepID=UPI0012EBD47A|nr:hypothetical protein [Pseudonocardia spinosispora]